MLKDAKSFCSCISDGSTSKLIKECLNEVGKQLQPFAMERLNHHLQKIDFGDSNFGKFSAEVVKV